MKCVVTVLSLIALAAIADEQASAQSRLPADLWDQLPQGFAIALTYEKSFATLNIKNTSDTEKIVRRSSLKISLFYPDAHGALVPLSNYKDRKKPGDRMEEISDEIDPPDSRGPMSFPPRMGVWYQVGVEITSEDCSLIKDHPIVCRVELFDLATNTWIHLESPPRMLHNNS